MRKGTAGAGDPANELLTMATLLEQVAADAARLPPRTPELDALSAEYQRMARGVATAAREMATAAHAKDFRALTVAQTKMEEAAAGEDPVVARINVVCRPRTR